MREVMGLYAHLRSRLCLYFQLRSIRRALVSPVREEQAEAIQALVTLHHIRGLRSALRTTDPWVRREAVKALARLQGAASARWIARALEDRDRAVAHAAAECLGSIAEPRVLWALRRCLVSEDWMVRYFGVMGLARLDAPHLRSELEKLQHDEHSWVRGAASLAPRRLTPC